jgi:hypothetical protein
MKEQGMTNLESSFYWLNELAEILNPYLDKKWVSFSFLKLVTNRKNLDSKKIEVFYFTVSI